MIKLTELVSIRKYTHNDKDYALREVLINPGHVVCVRSEPDFKTKLSEGLLPVGLDERQEFSRIVLSSSSVHGSVVVVGSTALIEEKLLKKQLLKG
jgi:hypothetical protein